MWVSGGIKMKTEIPQNNSGAWAGTVFLFSCASLFNKRVSWWNHSIRLVRWTSISLMDRVPFSEPSKGGGRELTPQCCPLTFTCALWHVCSAIIHRIKIKTLKIHKRDKWDEHISFILFWRCQERKMCELRWVEGEPWNINCSLQ